MRALVVAVIVGLPVTAAADALDEFGFGARSAGMAGAFAAVGTGAEATHTNPAGVALAEHPEVMVGYGYGTLNLELSGRDAQVLDAHGSSVGIAFPVPLGRGVVAAFGLGLYLPDQFIARIQLVPPTEPHFILLDNDPHRIVLEPVVSLAIGERLAIGAGASLLADARGNGVTFNVGVVSGEKVGEAAADVELPVRAAPLVGVLFAPVPQVRAGAAYRGELSLDLALDILANVDVAGVVTGDALVSVRATNYYSPHRVTGGAAVDVTADLTLSGELTWAGWSGYPSGLADLRAIVALDITPPLARTETPPADFEDTLSGRVGAEARFGGPRTRYAVRGGYGYLPSPVPEQTGLTSFADNDRHVLALGAGVTLADWQPYLVRPIELGLAVQWQHLAHRLTLKDTETLPAEAFSSGGNILYVGTSMKVAF